MSSEFSLSWWITGIAIPVIGAIFAAIVMLWRLMDGEVTEVHKRVSSLRETQENDRAEKRDLANKLSHEFYEFKVFVAMTYASMAYAKEIEARAKESQQRIETKLDKIENLIMESLQK